MDLFIKIILFWSIFGYIIFAGVYYYFHKVLKRNPLYYWQTITFLIACGPAVFITYTVLWLLDVIGILKS